MTPLTVDALRIICPLTKVARLEALVGPLNDAMQEFEIDTPARAKFFIAECAHESGGFIYTRELWGPTPDQSRYDLRADLGNTMPEAIEIAQRHGSTPGRFWSGHGILQTTGYDNHCKVRDALGIDCVENPDLLVEWAGACRSAGYFWKSHNLNDWADRGDFDGVSDIINRGHKTAKLGDALGYEDRAHYESRCEKVIV